MPGLQYFCLCLLSDKSNFKWQKIRNNNAQMEKCKAGAHLVQRWTRMKAHSAAACEYLRSFYHLKTRDPAFCLGRPSLSFIYVPAGYRGCHPQTSPRKHKHTHTHFLPNTAGRHVIKARAQPSLSAPPSGLAGHSRWYQSYAGV